ncbi:dynein light chain [Lynx pardinus]|uniref:Dynein light chain n=2 Tax=Lynx TaxID=13124 RepID=A0A485P3L6_LYNPA|nr:dynein light chain [Lynx pardinus]
MGRADGGARGGGAGAGRYFSGGRASAALSGRAERSCEAPARSRRAGRRARGGARAAGEARRADGDGERSARGCGNRRPRRRRLLPEEPRGHRPCPHPASGHRCSPGAPRRLASVKFTQLTGLRDQGGLIPSQGIIPISSVTMSDRKAVIKNADMSEDMQQDAVDCATQAMEKYNIEKDIAAYIKKEFDKKYNPTWHCIVGRNFGSYVTHETKHFIYFYLGQVAILLFKSG